MKVHSLLVGVYGPSLSCMHLGSFEPLVGSVGRSIWLVFRLTSLACSSGALTLSNLPIVFLSQWCISCKAINTHRQPKIHQD